MPSIAIIGAGLMGRLIALSLNRQGYQVTLFDKDDKNGQQSAAYAAAGLLTPLGEAMHSPANIVSMGFASLTLWPQLLSTLSGYNFFQQKGSLVVSHEQDIGDYHRLQRFLANNYSSHQRQQVNRQQLFNLEPELSHRFSQALFLPDEGQIGNRKLLISLKEQLFSEGINWFSNSRVTGINTNKTKLSYQTGNGSEIQKAFDLIIDCRGIGAKSSIARGDLTNAELKDLRAVRGELFQLFAPEVNISRPVRLMHPRYQLYIAPKGKGHFVVGATEIESDDTGPMTVRSAMELLSAAYSVHSGFAEANIRQHISQLRPAFSNNQPKIISKDNLIQVNGLYRHGFLIAPVVLSQVIEHVNYLFQKSSKEAEHYQYSHLLPITSNSTDKLTEI